MYIFFLLFVAPVANILSERFSHRIVIIAGGVIAGIGFITTSFVQDIGWVFVTYGLVAGKLKKIVLLFIIIRVLIQISVDHQF